MNILSIWNRLHALPGGKWLFSRILGKKIPYSGSMHALVEELEVGHAKVSLSDKRRVRNHLRSIHAVALMNLCELTSGLAMVAGLPPTLRGILVGFRIEYLKKARGKITGEARCVIPTKVERSEQTVVVELKNIDGDTVCRGHATWLIGPST